MQIMLHKEKKLKKSKIGDKIGYWVLVGTNISRPQLVKEKK